MQSTSRKEPSRVERSLGVPEFDSEGRYICVSFGRLTIASIYFPNGSGKERDNSRVPYKLDFYKRVFLSSRISVKPVQFMLRAITILLITRLI